MAETDKQTQSDLLRDTLVGADAPALTQAEVLQLLGSADTKEEMRARVVALAELASVLERRLRPERIATVFRRPAPVFGGSSMFELVGLGRHDEVLRSVHDSFDWSRTA